MNIDRLAQYYHNPVEMANHPLSELEELVQEYPFFTAGQLLLLKQYLIHNSSRYKKQHRKMLALAPDPVKVFLFTEGEAWIMPDSQEEHVSGEHVSGEHVSEEHVSGEHVSGEHVSGEHVSGEHVSGEHFSEVDLADGQLAAEELQAELVSDGAPAEDFISNKPPLELTPDQKEISASDFLNGFHDIQDWFRYYSTASQSANSRKDSEQTDSEYERELQLTASADLLNAPSGPLMVFGLDALRVKLSDEQGEPLSADSMHTIRILAQASIDDGRLPASVTLAEVFAGQQEWDHAIAIYEQLILMNPEKMMIFASRIAQLKQAKG
jgi:hypothetical protein